MSPKDEENFYVYQINTFKDRYKYLIPPFSKDLATLGFLIAKMANYNLREDDKKLLDSLAQSYIYKLPIMEDLTYQFQAFDTLKDWPEYIPMFLNTVDSILDAAIKGNASAKKCFEYLLKLKKNSPGLQISTNKNFGHNQKSIIYRRHRFYQLRI